MLVLSMNDPFVYQHRYALCSGLELGTFDGDVALDS